MGGDKNRVTPWWHLWVSWGHCDHGDKGWGDRDGKVGDILVSPGVIVTMGTRTGGQEWGTGMWGHMGTHPCVSWGHCDHRHKGWGHRDMGTQPCVSWGHCGHGDKGQEVTRTGRHHGAIFGSAGDTEAMGTKDGGTGMWGWDGDTALCHLGSL